MVTTSSVNSSEVTQQGSAVVAIAAGIELRAGGKQGRNTFSFTLTRSGDSTVESSVAWAVKGRGDNPAATQDFRGQQLPRGTVTFAAGETSRSVSVRVRPTDRQKDFALSLENVRGAVLGRSTARATIAPRDTLIGSNSDDRIQGSNRQQFIEGRAGRDLLTGGSKADQFGFRFGDSLIASPDRITDHRFGEDRIAVLNGKGQPQGLPRRLSRAADNSSATSLEDLAAAVFADANGRRAGNQALGRREAAAVVSTNAQIAGTYLLINNGKAGINLRNDLLIDVSGFSGDLPGLGRIDPALVFG
jgi:Ca2+-binding RTX toxin-like protein